MTGSNDPSGDTGAGSLIMDGAGSLVLDAANTFTGGITIASGTVELAAAGAAGSGAITFENDPTLVIDGSTMPTNDIDGFVAGDKIDLASIGNVAGSHVDMNYATNVLTITEGSNTYTLNFDSNASFAGDYFHLNPDQGGSGTLIAESNNPCYCPGTLIKTRRGQKRVERLKIGDEVRTRSGALRPIKWIGRRSYRGRFIMGRKEILPVCIKAGALEAGVPRRDLWISPHHAMYLDGVLIEAKDLVNGVSIVQAQSIDALEYLHVELETHDVIIAEGAPSETFVDDDDRSLFHNAHEYRALYPDAAPGVARYCAPRLEDGYEVERARRRIALQAGLSSQEKEPRAGALLGHIDLVSPRRIAGWAQDVDQREAPVCLEIRAGGRLIGQVLANRYRADLARAGLGSGRHGFEFPIPAGLVFAADTVEVRRALDGAALGLSIAALTTARLRRAAVA